MTDQWRRVSAAGVELDVPEALAPTDDAGLDGPAVRLEGPGLRLILDASPFADPLTGYADKPEYALTNEVIGGAEADVVSFRSDDGTRVYATRVPGRVTAVAHVAPDGDPEIAQRMLRSIRPPRMED